MVFKFIQESSRDEETQDCWDDSGSTPEWKSKRVGVRKAVAVMRMVAF